MLTDAIVLAGGRSTRLGCTPKAELRLGGRSLLEHALDAVACARRIVVVGPAPAVPLPTSVLLARESPLFAGPAAAIAAGLDALTASDAVPSTHTLVIACDMPGIAPAVELLLTSVGAGVGNDGPDSPDGAIGVNGDKVQPLAALYRTSSLVTAIARHSEELAGLSMFRLIGELNLTELALPARASDDIDTWADADRFGATAPHRTAPHPHESPTARSII